MGDPDPDADWSAVRARVARARSREGSRAASRRGAADPPPSPNQSSPDELRARRTKWGTDWGFDYGDEEWTPRDRPGRSSRLLSPRKPPVAAVSEQAPPKAIEPVAGPQIVSAVEPQLAPGVSPFTLLHDDAYDEVLHQLGVGHACVLKRVSHGWRARAWRYLLAELCGLTGAEATAADATRLNIEPLVEAGRLWDVAASRWHLPKLERLCGFGVEAPLAAVLHAADAGTTVSARP